MYKRQGQDWIVQKYQTESKQSVQHLLMRKQKLHGKTSSHSFKMCIRDSNREQYSRQKIENGIIRACYKRPVPTEKIQQAVNNIETKVFSLEEKEIPSSVVGELVMDELKDLDEVCLLYTSRCV